MRVWVFAAIAVVVSMVSSPVIASAAATPVPEMKADWSPWAFEIGTWVCHATLTNRPGDRVETDVNSMALDDHWMVTKFESPPFDPNRTKHSIGVGYLSWDSDNHMWYSWGADNFGGPIGYSTSPGWSGNQITMTAHIMKNGNLTTMGRTVTTKVSDTVIGPNTVTTATFYGLFNVSSNGQFTYPGTVAGTDQIKATFVNSLGDTVESNVVTKIWTGETKFSGVFTILFVV